MSCMHRIICRQSCEAFSVDHGTNCRKSFEGESCKYTMYFDILQCYIRLTFTGSSFNQYNKSGTSFDVNKVVLEVMNAIMTEDKKRVSSEDNSQARSKFLPPPTVRPVTVFRNSIHLIPEHPLATPSLQAPPGRLHFLSLCCRYLCPP